MAVTDSLHSSTHPHFQTHFQTHFHIHLHIHICLSQRANFFLEYSIFQYRTLVVYSKENIERLGPRSSDASEFDVVSSTDTDSHLFLFHFRLQSLGMRVWTCCNSWFMIDLNQTQSKVVHTLELRFPLLEPVLLVGFTAPSSCDCIIQSLI